MGPSEPSRARRPRERVPAEAGGLDRVERGGPGRGVPEEAGEGPSRKSRVRVREEASARGSGVLARPVHAGMEAERGGRRESLSRSDRVKPH